MGETKQANARNAEWFLAYCKVAGTDAKLVPAPALPSVSHGLPQLDYNKSHMEFICKHMHSLYLTACWPSHSPQTFDQPSQRWTDEHHHIGAKRLNNAMYFSPAQLFVDI